MGRITSGVGLVSGINYQDLIDQLMTFEARPKQLVQQRNAVLQSQQVAFQDINAKLLSLKLSVSSLASTNTFRVTSATSSNEDVLTATSGAATTPGDYNFTVQRLVSTQQMITRTLPDRDTTLLEPATLTFESAAARLERDTYLDELSFSGGSFSRGKIRIQDKAGNTATIDLSRAVTVNDILDAINANEDIGVTARVRGDALELSDSSGGAGALTVSNVGTATTATSLGIAGTTAGTTLTGSQINAVTTATRLHTLNDRTGVGTQRTVGAADFTIQQRDGTSFNVTLGSAATLGQALDAINNATGNTAITAAINDAGTGIKLSDGSVGGDLIVTAVAGSSAAVDLGIDGNHGDVASVQGDRLIAAINSRLLKNLQGGSGLGADGSGQRVIEIFTRDDAVTPKVIDLSSATSVADVIDLINVAGIGVTAAINTAGNGITLTDTTGGANDLVISDQAGTAAADLGLAGTHDADEVDGGNVQLRYIKESTRLADLNGGRGINRGRFTITLANGSSGTVDLTQGDELTIGDVLAEMNAKFNNSQFEARINDNGDGIYLDDKTGGGTAMTVVESGSTTARDLGILGAADSAGGDIIGSFERTITIDNVDYLEAATTLASLNEGEGVRVAEGQVDFQITTRDGTIHDINLDGLTTIDDVVTAIAAQTGGSVTAAINAAGTGLNLTDATSGNTTFAVAAVNGSQALADLGLDVTDGNADGILAGTSVVGGVTLQDLVDRINSLGAGVRATTIGDGRGGYSLSLLAARSGSAGAFIFDDGGLGLAAQTSTAARDAELFIGSPTLGKVIVSSSNTVDGVIPGASLSLKRASSEAVTLTVARNDDGIREAAAGFVEQYNALIDTIDKYDHYDTETQERGLLLGDSTLAQIESALLRLVTGSNGDVSGQFTRLSQIGFTIGTGRKLSFDETRFNNALAADREAVENLMTLKTVATDDDGNTVFVTGTSRPQLTAGGIAVRLDDLMARLLDNTLRTRTDGIDDQIELNNKRISDLDRQLENKRARLEAQFIAMERALAQIQSQGSALSSLASLAQTAYTSRNSAG